MGTLKSCQLVLFCLRILHNILFCRECMMKMKSLLIAIICLLPCVASAVDPPHGGAASGYNCPTCHATHDTLGSSGFDNICLNCHRSGSPKGGSKPFTIADGANPLGSMTGELPARMFQTSHNWTSPDTAPAAGAAPPLMAGMTTNRLAARTGNRLACVRCHNQHDNSNPPFLRMANNRDQMCLDCHRSRNVRSHTTGSHPVNFNYTGAGSKVRSNPAQYYNPPVNANPGNPTADLGRAMARTGGTLLCSSCHGVHYTDSSSATFDNHSGYYDLDQADGYLLRTDLRGATAGAVNLCSNCHAGKTAHNGRGQNIQCADCHGAHVEYDPNALTSQQKKPNVWLVRRYMNLSTASGSARKQPIYFQSTSLKNYKDAQGTGVCQSCHQVPTGAGYPPEHESASSAACNQCHFHGNAAGSFSAAGGGSCTSCHGYPPRINRAGGPNGYAVYNGTPSPFTNESSSPHGSHAGGSPYSQQCKECHQGNSHRTGTFQDVFNNTNGLVAAFFSAVPTFSAANPQAPTCATVYCHSDGAPRNAALVPVLTTKAIPGWANGRGAIIGQADECRRCHGDAGTLMTNSHGKHLAGSIGCASCHSATVSGNTTIRNFAVHANGVKDIQFSTFPDAVRAAWSEPAARCSAIVCHGSGTPVWGGTLWSTTDQCGTCHSSATTGAVTAGSPFYSTAFPVKTTANTDPKVGAHTDHITAAKSLHPGLACSDCHGAVNLNDATHMNGTTTFTWSVLAKTGNLSPAYNPATGTCSNVYCHGSAMPGGDTSGSNRTPVWNSIAYLPATLTVAACGTCHGFPPPPSSGHPGVSLPAGFPATAAIGTSCSCHGNINPAGNSYATIFVDKAMHVNGVVEVTGGGSCNSCHGYPPARPGFAGTFGNWSGARSEDYPGGGGAHTVANHVSKQAKPGEGFANCSKCHNALDHATSPLEFKPSQNIKVRLNQEFRYEPARQARYTSNRLDGAQHQPGGCLNISCHFGATPAWNQQ